ncbi:MAG TPA: protein translocase subunit SecD [Intrasporangium sp.]|nr:protein translocase subunit SecD [Intrasporangium sp.]
MARNYRPMRTVVVFFVGLAIAFGLVALAGSWTPRLGLDLQGGTRISLVASGQDVTQESLQEAATIIDSRVNGTGVSEAEVTTQGERTVVVEIPGEPRPEMEETVKRQAQLRFRVVACTSVDPGPCGAAAGTPQAPQQPQLPGSGVTVPSSPDADSGESSPKSRPPFLAKNGEQQTESPQDEQSESPSPTEPAPQPDAEGDLVDEPLKWMNSPDQASIQAFNEYECPPQGEAPVVEDDPDKPLVTCDKDGIKYLLSVSMIEGTNLSSAGAGIPDQSVNWAVDLKFDGAGTDDFTQISRTLFGTEKQFAIVLDGQVISAPTMNGVITNGEAQITGDFTEAEATSLATSLKFGALPIQFSDDLIETQTVGPSLAGNQLSAGLAAGALGLGLVMLYCLLYYRGLGLVVLASLIVAAALTYALVLLLSESAGFALSLPGVAGLIVGVGITADSFIVYFERIRDEMRDGKSMRVAAESGWQRARNTCLAADAVSLLAAVVLFIFATGVVRGFAFALGLSTLIDLVVFFWFTHPMVSWLARFDFFNRGHKLSGLDAESLGLDRLPMGARA